MDSHVAKHFRSYSEISWRHNQSTKNLSNENKLLQFMTNKEFINYLNRAFVLINVVFENNEDSRMYKSLWKYYYSKVPSEQKEIKSYIKEYEYCLIKYFFKTSQDKTNEKIIERVSNSNLKDGNVEVEFSIVQITSYLEASISKRSEKEHNTINLEISDFVKKMKERKIISKRN